MHAHRKKQSGFTIVELIIVIAVIGVLTSVLVPTFVGIINNANKATDIATVKNMNTALAISQKKHETMYDALQTVETNGITFDRVHHNKYAGHKIGWDSVKDRFVLVNEAQCTYIFPTGDGENESGVITNAHEYFLVYDAIPELSAQTYSIYVSDNVITGNDSENATTVKVTVGFDAGTNYYLQKVIYDRSGANGDHTREVIIRTNTGDCEYIGYDAGSVSDTINHFGAAINQSISVGSHSFVEYGSAVKNVIKKGHYVQEDGSIVAETIAKADDYDVDLYFTAGSTQGIVRNENELHSVTITAEKGADSFNVEVKLDGGPIEINYGAAPRHANTYDQQTVNDCGAVSISGLGDIASTSQGASSCPEHKYVLTEDGKLKICSNCGRYEFTTVKATTESENLQETTFTVDTMGNGTTVKTKDHEHNYGEPAWTWDGFTSATAKFSCTDDDCEHSKVLNAEVNDGVINEPVTCVEDGIKTYTASVYHPNTSLECKTSKNETILATGHTHAQPVSENIVAATCTEAGSYDSVVYCSVCNAEISRDTVNESALGHAYQTSSVTEPSCTEGGCTTHTCTRCGDSYDDECVNALGHNYVSVVTEPTCTQGGYTTYTCSRCNDSYTGNNTNAKGHNYGGWTVTKAATCTEDGERQHECQDCDYVESEIIPASGHAWDNGSCKTCGFCILLPNTDSYLYRVGNKNSVAVSSLFGGTTTVTTANIENVDGNATGVSDGTNITFSGTGVVKLKPSGSSETQTHLLLEVVDAVNVADGAVKVNGAEPSINATSYDVILLKNVSVGGAGSIVISNGYSLYGNGFTINCTGDGRRNEATGLREGYIEISGNGLIDNVVIQAPDFPKAYMYANTSSFEYGVKEDTNAIGSGRYGYQLSAVNVSGGATISNSYIYGARNNILASGNLTIDNCVLVNGSLANVHFSASEGTLNLNDVTTIQYLRSFDYTLENQPTRSATVIGSGILIGKAPESGVTVTSNPVINITGSLNQYNWVRSDYEITSSKIATSLISSATSNNNYKYTVDGKNYANICIVYLNNVAPEIHDSRTNHGYVLGTMTISGASGRVYAQGAGTSSVELKDSSFKYTPNSQGAFAPHAVFDYATKNYIAFTNPDENYCYFDSESGKVKILLRKETTSDKFTYDPMILNVSKCGESFQYSVKMNGTDYTNKTIQFSETGEYTLVYSYTDPYNYDLDLQTYQKSYELNLKISVLMVEPEAVIYHPTFTYSGYNTKIVTIGEKQYVMPDVSETSGTIGSMTIGGTTVYYPIQDVKGRNSGNSQDYSKGEIYFFAPAFLAINITDYDQETGEAKYIYNKNSQKWPHNLASDKGPANIGSNPEAPVNGEYFGFRGLDGSTNKTKVPWHSSGGKDHFYYAYSSNSGLCFKGGGYTSSRAEDHQIAEFYYRATDGQTYYYIIDYHYIAVTYSSCVAEGTLVTMGDGTQKPIEEIGQGDIVLTWSFWNGQYEAVPVAVKWYHGTEEYEVTTLHFSDGNDVRVINEHGFFDADLHQYVYITPYNVDEYVGHRFVKHNNGETITVVLAGYEITNETIGCYSMQTAVNDNFFTEDILSITSEPFKGYFDRFELGEGMKYDAEAMQEDIEQYGLYTPEEWSDYLTPEEFYAVNGQYFKILIGRGVLTYEDIFDLIRINITENP